MDKMELKHLERLIWVWMFWDGERRLSRCADGDADGIPVCTDRVGKDEKTGYRIVDESFFICP